jgi:hypothetical protein
MIGKQEERRQRARGVGASIGRGCALRVARRGGGRVERMTGRGIDATGACEKLNIKTCQCDIRTL